MMHESGMTLDRSVFNDCFRRASRTIRYVCTLADRYLVSSVGRSFFATL